MIRIATICAAFVLLTAAQCDRKTIEHYSALATTDPQPAMAFLAVEALEEVVEPVVIEPPVYVWTCWTEWHRAGTMAVEVCENRLVQ